MSVIKFTNFASGAIVSGITDTATSVTLAAGVVDLMPTIGTGEIYYLGHVNSVSGVIDEIVKVTAAAGSTLTIARHQDGTTAVGWLSGDTVKLVQNAAAFDNMVQKDANQSRTRLIANKTFYVATTGSNSNDGLTVGTPWLTLQYAWDTIKNNYDLNGKVVTIQLADGTYTGALNANGQMTGINATDNVLIKGNSADSSAVVISTSSSAIYGKFGSKIKLQYLTITTTGGGSNSVIARYGSIIEIGAGVVFGVAGNGQIVGSDGGLILISGAYSITGGGAAHIIGSVVIDENVVSPITITVTGTPNFSAAFCLCSHDYVRAYYLNFSGGATGQRYRANVGGYIQTNGGGANFFPGNVAGDSTTGYYD